MGSFGTYRNEFGVAQGRQVQHPRDREEIEARALLTSKYEFILPSDLPEFACRAIVSHACSIPKDRTAGRVPIAIAGAENIQNDIALDRRKDAHEHVGAWDAFLARLDLFQPAAQRG